MSEGKTIPAFIPLIALAVFFIFAAISTYNSNVQDPKLTAQQNLEKNKNNKPKAIVFGIISVACLVSAFFTYRSGTKWTYNKGKEYKHPVYYNQPQQPGITYNF